tara:strand:- start:787 stop:1425 length:639 start_codon:yes stop_codon:yes gene_type:complete
MFKKIFLPLIAVACFAPLTYADVSGSVGVDSDYFWRGVSQNNGDPANSFNLEYQGDGFYVGTWASDVNFAGDKDHEFDFYAGYALAVTDAVSIDVGLIHYTYDTLKDDLDELYLNVGINNFSLAHYRDIDNGGRAFTQVGYTLPFISQLDVEVFYALHSEDNKAFLGLADDDYFGINLSKDLGDFTIKAMIMDDARHGDFWDMASIGLHYNF